MAKSNLNIHTFTYECRNKQGKIIRGEISDKNLLLAKAQLRKMGLNPIKIKKKPKSLFSTGKKIKPADIAFFARQLATMLKAGVPLVQSFDIIARGQKNPNFTKLVLEVKQDVETGRSLGQALTNHPKHFDNLFCSLVNSGEQSGTLETMLGRIATYKEKTESLKGKIKKAMVYPIAVVCIALGVTVFLLVKVVPTFKELFESSGSDLPALTKTVVAASEAIQNNWVIVTVILIAIFFSIRYLAQNNRDFQYLIARKSLKLPVFGAIFEQAIIARFARTLATTFAAGVPLMDALDSVAETAGNLIYRDGIRKIRSEAGEGTPLQQSLHSSGLFPNMVVQMVAIGEESGSLEHMLNKVADYYEEQVDNAVDALSSLLEPFIIVFIGAIVGFIVVAMYLPIFSMGQAF